MPLNLEPSGLIAGPCEEAPQSREGAWGEQVDWGACQRQREELDKPVPVGGGADDPGAAEKARSKATKGRVRCIALRCDRELDLNKNLQKRAKLCKDHLDANSVQLRDGSERRFCKRCLKLHSVESFHGDERVCVEKKAQFNAVRRLRRERSRRQSFSEEPSRCEDGSLSSAGLFCHLPPAFSVPTPQFSNPVPVPFNSDLPDPWPL